MQSSAELVCVDPARVQEVWPRARLLIKAAVDHTGLADFDYIERDVLAGSQLLWLAIGDEIEAAATTRLAKANGQLACELTACSGSQMERWLPRFERIEQFARDEGCKCVRIIGRGGWQRVLKNYRVEHVILERPL